MSTPAMYEDPRQFEPLLPQKRLDELYAIAQTVAETSLRLQGHLHNRTARSLTERLRAMNSYYSNKIEGQSTHPLNIERALHKNFAKQPRTAKLQRLAIAHIDAEREIEQWTGKDPLLPFRPDGIQRIHAALYQRLSDQDRTTDEGVRVEPGQWRNQDVDVGRHIPPSHTRIAVFLERYAEGYAREQSWDKLLVSVAAAHQRLLWIHPFVDGNGRVARLASHTVLASRLSGGLWSVSRGLARTRADYYTRLEDADENRRGDLDGRGNLSEQGLWNWCKYFLDICLDQATFMSRMLELDGMRDRIRALVTFRAGTDKNMRPEAVLPLHYLFTAGPMTRGEFQQMTGLRERNARSLLSHLLEIGLVESDSRLGPVRFGLPLDSLQFYFPNLYPEASVKSEED